MPAARLSVTPLEDRLTPYVFGADDRVPSALGSVVRIVSEFPDGTSEQGSGVFVNNFHVLTAGHVIWDKKYGGMARRVVVQQPSYDRDTGRLWSTFTGFGNVLRVSKGWADSRDFNQDWGLVRLTSDSVANGAWGLQVMAAVTDPLLAAQGANLETAGFPGDKGGKTQYRTPAPAAGSTAQTVASYGDTYAGQSGGPLFLDRGLYQDVYGVVSNEAVPAGSRPNSFTRLTPALVKQLDEYMAADNAAYAALPPTQHRLTVVPVGASGSGGFRGAVASTSESPPADAVPPVPLTLSLPPPADLAESNSAVAWSVASTGPAGSASVADDLSYRVAGGASVVATAPGVVLGTLTVRYASTDGVLDVSAARSLGFTASVQLLSGTAPLGGSIQLKLTDSAGNSSVYEPRNAFSSADPALNFAVGGWHRFDVPLAPAAVDTWGVSYGTARTDLTQVVGVEFRLYYLTSDIRLWLDDVNFRGYPPAGDESPVVPVNAPPDPYGPGTSPDQNTAFVKGLYRTVLGRDADAGGVASWTAAMLAGATPLQVTAGFWNSPENRAVQVDRFYRTFLGREPDAAGREHWMTLLLTGQLDESGVAQQFLLSPECVARGGTTGGYVDLLYMSVLGRPADPAGRADWVRRLDTGAISRAQLVAGILRSDESYNRILTSFYRAYLKRGASAAELADWRRVLAPGTVALGDVAVGFVGSAEFYANAAGAVG